MTADVLPRSLSRILVTVLGTALFAATTQWIYANLITGPFSYSGYTYVVGSWPSTVTTVSATAAVALLLPTRILRPSHVILWLLFIICVAPTMLVGNYSGYLTGRDALLLTGVVGIAFGAVALLIPRGAVPDETRDKSDTVAIGGRSIRRSTIFWIVCAVYSLVTYGVMTATIGLSLHLPSLDDIYDVRAEYTEDVGNRGLLGYLLTGQAYVVNTIVLARGLSRRNWTLVALAVGGQAMIYSGTGFKAVLFSFPAVLIMAFLMRGGRRPTSTWFVVGPTALMILSSVADSAQGTMTWTSVFARRFIVTPGLLSSVYVDYFEQYPVARYGYSFLSNWVDYPYDLPPPKRIAQFMVPGSSGYANANLFADGFANFGWGGILLAAGVLLVWLRLVDRFAKGLPVGVAALVLVMPSVTLSNTSIFTAMLSHGLVVGTALLAMAPRSGWYPVRQGAAAAASSGEQPIDADEQLSGRPRGRRECDSSDRSVQKVPGLHLDRLVSPLTNGVTG